MIKFVVLTVLVAAGAAVLAVVVVDVVATVEMETEFGYDYSRN